MLFCQLLFRIVIDCVYLPLRQWQGKRKAYHRPFIVSRYLPTDNDILAIRDGRLVEVEMGAAEKGGGGRVRVTVDLSREQHRFLRQFALDNGADGMKVLRALLVELEEDEALVERVRERLGV